MIIGKKHTTGGADYKLYLSRQEVLEEKESEEIYSKIKGGFNGWNNHNKFSLDQLKRIEKIINENIGEEE